MKLAVLTILGAASLMGCCDKNDAACKAEQATTRPSSYVTQPAPAALPTTTPQRRVVVERVDVVADSLAYGKKRGVYVIRDTQTGREFIGVSGVGVAETGKHQSGKTQAIDER